MKELSLEERKEISIQLLNRIHDTCVANKITYYLAYGSLLGAVRHKGFIPWDDDIDIWVPVNHVNKLLTILEKDESYCLLDHRKGEDWDSVFSKFYDPSTIIVDRIKTPVNQKISRRGVAVDIFPLFYIPDKKFALKTISVRDNRRRQFGLACDAYKKRPFIQMYLNALKLLGRDTAYYHNRLINLENFYDKCEYYGCPISPYEIKDIHHDYDFELIELEFNKRMYYAPSGYDKILTNLYGDYLSMPPVEKRKSNHDVVAYLL